jgi:hypothetical protein
MVPIASNLRNIVIDKMCMFLLQCHIVSHHSYFTIICVLSFHNYCVPNVYITVCWVILCWESIHYGGCFISKLFLCQQFPSIGELLLNRLVIQFRRGFKRNDKTICISAATFVAHLVNQRVVSWFYHNVFLFVFTVAWIVIRMQQFSCQVILVSMKSCIVWDMMSCWLVNICWCFE